MSFDAAQKLLDAFLADIRPIEDVYQDETFSYFAVKSDSDFNLIQGTLYLNVRPPIVPIGHFQSQNVKSGHFRLSDVGLVRGEFIERIKSGHIPIPGGELRFVGNLEAGRYGASYSALHEFGLPNRRVGVLSIFGGQSSELLNARRHDLDWEVRASANPFDGIQELLSEYSPGILRGVNRVDITALEVAAIDVSSRVHGEKATLVVLTAAKANPEKLTIGVRVLNQGKVVRRSQLLGKDFLWTEAADGMRLGKLSFDVPRAAVIHATANYDGIAQHFSFFGDPLSFQNPRRAAYEAFDAKLETMLDIISKATGRGQDAREFEATMPWLFWMLGFAPAYVGGPPRMRDAADFLMCAPNGQIAVVECTTGLLKDDSKLPKLHDRAEAVRRKLDDSSTRDIRVLPIIITTKAAEAIKPDVDQAEKLGIHVISAGGLEDLIRQTLFPPNAEQLFEQFEKAVRDALAKHNL